MSGEEKESDAAEDAAFEEESTEEPEVESGAEAGEESSPGRKWPLIAGVVVVGLVAAGGWYVWNQLESSSEAGERADAVARLSSELGSSRETITALKGNLDEQQEALRQERERVTALENRISELANSIEQPTDILGSLPSRVATLERGLSSLQGISEGTRDNWLLAEAEYFLQIANAQVELAKNPTLAIAALEQADERVAELSNPAYTPVRAAIADEIAALSLMTDVDMAGMILTLSSLSRIVDSLPVRRDEEEEDTDDAPIDPEASGFSRAWEAVKDTASKAVTVTRPGEERSPLLTPESESLLRANLSLQLQAARLALLKGEREIFTESLDDAESWLVDYFDTDSVQVQSARMTINEVRDSPAMNALPDISGSLAELKRLRTLGESQQ